MTVSTHLINVVQLTVFNSCFAPMTVIVALNAGKAFVLQRKKNLVASKILAILIPARKTVHHVQAVFVVVVTLTFLMRPVMRFVQKQV